MGGQLCAVGNVAVIVRLHAPFAGWAMPLDQVPDVVFAERMMGEGFAIEPLEGTVRSPCDATVVAIAPTRHSISLRLLNGADLLIHVGVDTVALKGEGFSTRVKVGDKVSTGQTLLMFDLDAVATRAKSVVTPIVVVNEGFGLRMRELGRRVASGGELGEVEGQVERNAQGAPGEDTARCEIQVALPDGVHARPAARIVSELKRFAAEVTITVHGKTVNARSVVALLAAGIRASDDLVINGRGADARAAVTAVAGLLEEKTIDIPASVVALTPQPRTDSLIQGVCGSPGVAIGEVYHWRLRDLDVAEEGRGAEREATALTEALRSCASAQDGDGSAGQIGAAHAAMLEDPELLAAAQVSISLGKSAAFAWRQAINHHAEAIRASGDPLLIERVADLKDIERQVIQSIIGEAPSWPTPPSGAIVIAEELLPSHMAAIIEAGVSGICTAAGGPTAHATILAAAAGIPMVVAAGSSVLMLEERQMVILDAGQSTLDPDPSEEARSLTTGLLTERRLQGQAERRGALADCFMADGTRIEIFANLSSVDEARQAVGLGAEGCGLLRTEFLFLDREAMPDENEQCATYAAIAAELAGRPLIIRTLDIGGDKPVAYLPSPPEDNPALGVRGIRLALSRPDVLAAQLRAMLRGVPPTQCRIMLPMIVDAGELAAARSILDAARLAIGMTEPVALGVMVETPAAALLAETLARDADFLSIGTNDLTQYALAADRGNPAVAHMVDAFHPAVLRLISLAADGARLHRRWLGVCGSMASDPLAAPLLIGLGATELSAVPRAVPKLKAVVRQLDLNRCRELAQHALAASSPNEVRALLEKA